VHWDRWHDLTVRSVVNKDSTFKANDKNWDLKAKVKDLGLKAKVRDLEIVLKGQPKARTKAND
jgi:hypothetical protein